MATRRADADRLTSKLADVAQNVVVTMHDCGTPLGISKWIPPWFPGGRQLSDLIHGRVACKQMKDPRDDTVIVRENEMITCDMARKIEKLGIERIMVRSPMTCQAPLGVCRLCYGLDLSTGALVDFGTAVGIIAAQSIGEPSAQLTPRTYHLGGRDLISSLARVRELFEASTPRNPARMAEVSGIVRLGQKQPGKRQILITPTDTDGNPTPGRGPVLHEVSLGPNLRFRTGDRVKTGDRLTSGELAPRDILQICGIEEVQRHLVQEIQAVYRAAARGDRRQAH